MTESELIARNLLADIEPRLNIDHITSVSERHRLAQNFDTVDRLPLSLYVPYEGTLFRPYPVREMMEDPAKMLVNELLLGFSSIYHLVDLSTDTPLSIRPNLGVTIIASLFGAQIEIRGNQPPWVQPLDGLDQIKAAIEAPPDVRGGLLSTAFEMYAYFHDVMADFPKCRQALQISLPDLQGPFDIAELLWGSGIFIAFYSEPEILTAFLETITTTILLAYQKLLPFVREDLRPETQYQHATSVRGKLLLRADTAIMISPQMYKDFLQPYDAYLADKLDGVGIHFCGNGQHQILPILEIDNLQSLDFGQSQMMNMEAVYALARERGVTLNRIQLPGERLTAATASALFPTGVTLLHESDNLAQASAIWSHYINGDNHGRFISTPS